MERPDRANRREGSQPERDLERDLERLLRAPMPAARLDDLDARVARVAASDPSAAPHPSAWRRLVAAMGTLAATAVIAAVLVTALVSGRLDGPSATASPVAQASAQSPAASAGTPSPSASASASASGEASAMPEGSAPDATATPGPTPAPTGTPRPTARPTAAPEPTPDPRPEPTPAIYRGTGSLGAPVTVHGITVTMSPTDVPATVGDVCAKYGRESLAYSLHVTWRDPVPNSEPWLYVGSTPYFVIWWEPAYAVNADVVTVLCHVPGESQTVHVEISDGPDLVRWTLKP